MLFLEAAECYARLLDVAPGSPRAQGGRWGAGHCYYKASKFSTGAAYLEDSLDDFQEHAFVTQARYELGRCLQAEGHFADAILYYDMNIRDNPGNVFTHFSRLEKGRCLLAIGEFQDATDVFRDITEGEDIKIDPANPVWRDARFGLATALHRAGDASESLYVYKELLDWYPDDPRTGEVAYWFAEAMRSKAAQGGADSDGLYRQAIDYYGLVTQKARLKAFAGQIGDVVVRNCYNYIGLCYFQLGDYYTAIQKYNDFAERYDSSPEAIHALKQVAVCYGKLGLPTEEESAEKRMLYFLRKYNESRPEEPLSENALF
jgi:tetratricopeptide (TPR) repeat protein